MMISRIVPAFLFLAQSVVAVQSGTVSGRILLTNGSPATNVRVSAWVLNEAPDAPSVQVSITLTDSQGRYELPNIPPGRYRVGAGALDNLTYFPGVLAAPGATIVTVAPGVVTAGVDFQIQPASTTFKVGGVLLLRSGEPRRLDVMSAHHKNFKVFLLDGQGKYLATTGVSIDGTFEFGYVHPGSYRLNFSPTGLGPPLTIVVTDRDISGLVIKGTG